MPREPVVDGRLGLGARRRAGGRGESGTKLNREAMRQCRFPEEPCRRCRARAENCRSCKRRSCWRRDRNCPARLDRHLRRAPGRQSRRRHCAARRPRRSSAVCSSAIGRRQTGDSPGIGSDTALRDLIDKLLAIENIAGLDRLDRDSWTGLGGGQCVGNQRKRLAQRIDELVDFGELCSRRAGRVRTGSRAARPGSGRCEFPQSARARRARDRKRD